MNSIIKIDKKQILKFKEEAGKLYFTPKAEKQLQKLIEIRDWINEQIEEVKSQIAEAGLAVDKDFKGVVGENLRAVYRVFGEKFIYDKEKVELAKPFLKEVKFYKVDSKKVEEYAEKVGELPEGILEKARVKKISIIPSKQK